MFYALALVLLPRPFGCEYGLHEWPECKALGTDISDFLNSWLLIGFVFIPFLLAWGIIGGLILWFANIIDGRSYDHHRD